MKVFYLGLLSSFVILLGCEEFIEPNTDQFIIEGFLTAGEVVNDIKVKESLPLDLDVLTDLPISNAEIVLSGNDSEISLTYNEVTGKYFDPSGDFQINVDDSYQISIAVNGEIATAETVIPEQPSGISMNKNQLIVPSLILTFGLGDQIRSLFEEETITLTWDPVEGRSYYVVIESLEETLDPILPEGIPEDSRELLSSFRFVSEPSETASFEIIAVALETYGRHVAKVYSVNQEYVDLFNSATQDSRDLNEPPTNVVNGLGIFSGFAVASMEFEVSRN